MTARVIVLAGPSGAGKSHLAKRVGLPVLRLDDFYKDGDDPSLPCVDLGGGTTVVDWDDAASWSREDSLAAIESLCRDGAPLFIAEGIFAQEVIAGCREAGVLAEALCITQHPLLTAVRRLTRDLAERRKSPLVLVKRGWHLMRAQPSVVADAVAHGARVASPDEAFEIIQRLS
ncbi:MAG: ATP-binding protein [Myxococcales bacterium]|nr:MAG: ATP-binding protein [Myxococcales bacterium]